MSTDLVILADIKTMLDISGTAHDTKLTLIQDSVTQSIERYIGRILTYDEYTESVFVGSNATNLIPLEPLPIDSVSSLTVLYHGSDTSDTLTETSDFSITNYGIKLFSKITNSKLSITYTGGYATDDVPKAITRAALLQTIFEFSSGAATGATSVSSEGGSIQWPELGLLDEVKNLLNDFKHPFMLV